MKKDDIEDLFKKSFEEYEAEVNPSVWKNIRIGLKWGGLALLFNTILNKIGTTTIIAILSAVAVISTVAILNKSKSNADKTPPAANESPISAVKTSDTADSENKVRQNNTEPKELSSKVSLDTKASDDGQKSVLTSANTAAETEKKENKKTEPAAAKLSVEPIASIVASTTNGTAPLIVELTNNGIGKTNKWKYSDGKKANSAPNSVHVFETPGVFSVVLSSVSADGRTAIDSIKVEVTGYAAGASVPKEFSPNGDGVLDELYFKIKNIAKMKAEIFDNKGNVVYKSESIDAKWDGKDLSGKEAKEGIYFYLINAEGADGKKYEPKGSIKLTR